MSIYRTLKGYNIKSVTSDPANTKEGQIWYNDTTNKIRVNTVKPAAWASGGNLGTARERLGAAGTQTAGLAFGGNLDPGNSALTESWNGTNWTEVSDLNQVRNGMQGNGTSTASFAVGGAGGPSSAVTEEWNGASWAEVGDLNTARTNLSSARAGTTTNALAFAGAAPSVSTATEEWSGSSNVTKTVSTD